jgi:hypothetical protein
MTPRAFCAACLVIASATVFAAPGALGCTCLGDTTPQKELRECDAVFTGRALRRQIVTMRDARIGGERRRMLQFTFEVDSQWKGSLPRRITILTGLTSGECGHDFDLRIPYIVYARRSQGQLHMSICDRTNRLDQASDDLKALGQPT